MIKLSDYVMGFLATHGVRHVFMLPGGGAMHLDDSLGRCRQLEYTCFMHEQALAIAAEAYGQHTNRPGVGLVTSGPGGTNTITGVAAAYIDSTPVVFLSGQAKRPDLKTGTGVRQMGSQEVDIVSLVQPITKYAVIILHPEEIRYHLEKAWYLATTGRMGPVWLDFPLDVQAAMIDETALRGFTPEDPASGLAEITRTAETIMQRLKIAKRPLMLAGNGVKAAGAQESLLRFASANHIPVLLTWKAIDFLDCEHPLNFGCPGIMGSRTANFMVQNCDLLLMVGTRLDPSITAFNAEDFGRHAYKVMVDIDPAEIRKINGLNWTLVADAGEMLEALNALPPVTNPHREWIDYGHQLNTRYPMVPESYWQQGPGINLYVFTDQLFRQLRADDVIVPESAGAAGEVTYQAMRVKQGQAVKNAAGLGAMGFGLPYAVGACIAHDRKRTVLINGDGAFQLNIQELETVARLRLPIKMFIFNNDGYASIRTTQNKMFGGFHVGSGTDSGLSMPNLGAIAAAYGLRVETAASHAELAAVIERVLAGDDPVLCNIQVAAEQITAPRVQAMKRPDGGMVSKPLEDMWPYLPPEELAANMIAEKDGK